MMTAGKDDVDDEIEDLEEEFEDETAPVVKTQPRRTEKRGPGRIKRFFRSVFSHLIFAGVVVGGVFAYIYHATILRDVGDSVCADNMLGGFMSKNGGAQKVASAAPRQPAPVAVNKLRLLPAGITPTTMPGTSDVPDATDSPAAAKPKVVASNKTAPVTSAPATPAPISKPAKPSQSAAPAKTVPSAQSRATEPQKPAATATAPAAPAKPATPPAPKTQSQPSKLPSQQAAKPPATTPSSASQNTTASRPEQPVATPQVSASRMRADRLRASRMQQRQARASQTQPSNMAPSRMEPSRAQAPRGPTAQTRTGQFNARQQPDPRANAPRFQRRSQRPRPTPAQLQPPRLPRGPAPSRTAAGQRGMNTQAPSQRVAVNRPQQPMMARRTSGPSQQRPQAQRRAVQPTTIPLANALRQVRRSYASGRVGTTEEYRRLIQLYPFEPTLPGELGNIYYQQGKLPQAAEQYYETAMRFIRRNQPGRAACLLRVLQRIDPARANALSRQTSQPCAGPLR